MLGTLRERAVGLELVQLEGRLSAQHLAVLRDLERTDAVHLASLLNALRTFRAASTSRIPHGTVLRLAQNLASLYRSRPAVF